MKKLLLLLLILTSSLQAQFFKGRLSKITYVSTGAKLDSVRVKFYPNADTVTSMTSCKLIPCFSDSLVCAGVDTIDTLGIVNVSFRVYPHGSSSSLDRQTALVTNYILSDDLGRVTALGGGGGGCAMDSLITQFLGATLYAESIQVLSSIDSAKIEGAKVYILSEDGKYMKYQGLTTDADGITRFYLPLDTFVVVVYYIHTMFSDTIVIAGSTSLIHIYMNDFDIPAPSNPGLCNVWGYVRSGSLGLVGAKIVAEIVSSTPVRYLNDLIQTKHTVYSDSMGLWIVELYKNGDLTPSNTKWKFNITYQGNTLLNDFSIIVPDEDTWRLTW